MSTFITDTAIEGQTKLFVNKPATYDEPIRDISPIKAQPEPLNHSLASRPKLEEKSLRELKPVVSSKVFPTSQRAEGSKQLNKLEMPKFTSPSVLTRFFFESFIFFIRFIETQSQAFVDEVAQTDEIR